MELCAAYAAASRVASVERHCVAVARASAERHEPLTVTDIRRARRSTRLSLDDVSERSRIPTWLIHELEWGDFRHWPGGVYGRTQLLRYARAAGLDEALVVQTLWPLIQDSSRARATPQVFANHRPSHETAEHVTPAVSVDEPVAKRRPRRWVATGAAVFLLVGIAAVSGSNDWFTERHESAPATKVVAQPPALPSVADRAPRRPVAARGLDRSSPKVSRNRRGRAATRRAPRRGPLLSLRVTVVDDLPFHWPY